ncbi:MAG: hypothetical protein HPY30_13755 [Gammaproteobacteria bacterium (ex Lamellibrachia satsuma)]|nr:MAG: hypothetical protein HPY30_13755 [Gammaproteobacteria bacterium (ex Lamellibrachia satsuma)]
MKKMRVLTSALVALVGVLSTQQSHAFFGFFDDDDDYYPRHWRRGGPYGWNGPYGRRGPYGWGSPYGWGNPYGWGYPGHYYPQTNNTQKPPPPLPRPE